MVDDGVAEAGAREAMATIKNAEVVVGRRLSEELAGYIQLASDLTEFGSSLVGGVARFPQEPTARHVGGVLLARILTELQACVHLVRLGYAGQATTLVTTMVELMHALEYIGTDDVRAEAWLQWSDVKNAYPGIGMATMFATVARNLGVDESRVRRDYETVYREASMVKHGNPLSMAETNVVSSADSALIVIGPVPSERFVWLAHAALQWATRYAFLAELSFIRCHLSPAEQSEQKAQSVELSERHAEVTAASQELAPPQ